MPNGGCVVNEILYGVTANCRKNGSGLPVSVIKRQKGSRRRYLYMQFPLTDSCGEFVFQERRQLPDRRKLLHDINDLKTILSKIYSE